MPPRKATSKEALSPQWLQRALDAQRADVARFLEQRHSALLAEVVALSACDQPSAEPQPSSVAKPVFVDCCPPGTCDEFEIVGEKAQPDGCKCSDGKERPEAMVGVVPSAPSQDTLSQRTADYTPLQRLGTRARLMRRSLGERSEQLGSSPTTYRLVSSSLFETGIAAVIMLNLFAMAAQVQYQSFGIGLALEYPKFDKRPQDRWVHASTVFSVLDYTFGVIYCFELALKVHAYRLDWANSFWNWFDAAVVVFWIVEMLLQDLIALPADLFLLRALRLFRLLRLVKINVNTSGLDSLHLLLKTMRGSLKILGWSVILLLIVQILIGLMMVFYLNETYFLKDSYPVEERREVFKYFGSFSRALLSMFEMTLANWPPVCRLLVENVSEWFMFWCLAHKLTIGFAVISIINGVFMQETFKVTSSDDQLMIRAKQKEEQTYSQKIQRLFSAADADGDGRIDEQAFAEMIMQPRVLAWLSAMDLPVRDPELLFQLLDDEGEGELTAEKMTASALRLRGQAKSVDLLALTRQVDSLMRSLHSSASVP